MTDPGSVLSPKHHPPQPSHSFILVFARAKNPLCNLRNHVPSISHNNSLWPFCQLSVQTKFETPGLVLVWAFSAMEMRSQPVQVWRGTIFWTLPHEAGVDPDVAVPKTRHNHAKSRSWLISFPVLIVSLWHSGSGIFQVYVPLSPWTLKYWSLI